MRRRTLLPALLLGVGLLGLLALTTPANENVDTKKIDKLIEQLGSDSFEERRKAYDGLDAIGAPALEALRKASASKDAEVRKRAGELVEKIAKRLESATVLTPKMIHLVYKDTPVTDAVADLKKKSGYLIVLHDPDNKLKDKKITLDTGKVSFWNALEQLCAKAGLVEDDANATNLGRPIGVRINPLPPAKNLPKLPAGAVPGANPPPVEGKPLPPVKVKSPEELKKEAEKKDDKKDDKKKEAEQPAGIGVGKAGPAVLPPQPAVGAPGVGRMLPGQPRRWLPVQQGQITLLPGTPDTAKADTRTSFRIRSAAKTLHRITDKEIALLLQITPEPRIRLQRVLSVTIDKAIDNNDQKLSVAQQQAVPGVGVGIPGGPGAGGPGGGVMILPGAAVGRAVMFGNSNGLSQNTTVRLQKGDKETKSLKELTGLIAAQVNGEAEKMIVADKILKAAGKTFKGKQGGEMKILTVEKKDGTVQITFEFEMPSDVLPESQVDGPAPAMPALPLAPGGGALPAQPPGGAKVPALPAKPPAAGAPGGVGIAIVIRPIGMPQRFAYNGLTLQDDKGKVLQAQVTPNWKKGGLGGPGGGGPGGGGLAGGQAKKVEYIATYKPMGKDAAEPASLVFTGRRQIEVSIPFTLKNIDLK